MKIVCFWLEVVLFLKNDVAKFGKLLPFSPKWRRIRLRKKEKFQEKNFFKDKNRVLNVYIDVLTFQKGNLCTIFCLVEMRKF